MSLILDPKNRVYPSWRHHRTMEPVIVRTEAHDDALGDEWQDLPVWDESLPPVENEVSIVPDPPKRGPGRPAKKVQP